MHAFSESVREFTNSLNILKKNHKGSRTDNNSSCIHKYLHGFI